MMAFVGNVLLLLEWNQTAVTTERERPENMKLFNVDIFILKKGSLLFQLFLFLTQNLENDCYNYLPHRYVFPPSSTWFKINRHYRSAKASRLPSSTSRAARSLNEFPTKRSIQPYQLLILFKGSRSRGINHQWIFRLWWWFPLGRRHDTSRYRRNLW